MESLSWKSFDSVLLMLTRSTKNGFFASVKKWTRDLSSRTFPILSRSKHETTLNTGAALMNSLGIPIYFSRHGQPREIRPLALPTYFSTDDALSTGLTFLFAMHLLPRRTRLSKGSFDCPTTFYFVACTFVLPVRLVGNAWPFSRLAENCTPRRAVVELFVRMKQIERRIKVPGADIGLGRDASSGALFSRLSRSLPIQFYRNFIYVSP